MDILGIGPLELLFILIIALIIFGPDDLGKMGKSIGRFLRDIVTSQEWKTVQQASKQIRTLPNRLMREAELEDINQEILGTSSKRKLTSRNSKDKPIIDAWTTPPPITSSHPPETPIIPPEN